MNKRGSNVLLALLGILTVAVLGAVGIWAAFFREKKTLQSLATDRTIPPAAPKTGCSPDFVNAQAQALVTSSAGGAQSGGAYGAAGAAAPALLGVLAGPCGPNIEKKLKELAASLDPHIGERANAVLRQWDRQRLGATRIITNPIGKASSAVARTTKAVTSPVNTAKSFAKKVGF